MRAFIKFIVILIVVLAIIAGAGYIMLNFGERVMVEWAQTDLDSLLDKIDVDVENIDDLNVENIARGGYTTNRSQNITAYITSEEFSAMVASSNDKKGPIREFKILFADEGQLELSFRLAPGIGDLIDESGIMPTLRSGTFTLMMLDLLGGGTVSLTDRLIDYLSGIVSNKPIYAAGTLVSTGRNSVSVEIEKLKVGSIPMNSNTIDLVEEKTEYFINNFITSENGFYINELRIEDGKLYYRGSLPSDITGIPLD